MLKKILYVEDARAQREIMKKMLELYGEYEVTIADNGQDGLEKARKMRPDVILIDLRMPVMSGHKAIQKLKEDPDLADIPVIAISAWGNRKSREAATKAGAIRFFEKPINYSKLLAALREVVDDN